MNTLSKWLRSTLDYEDENIFNQPIYEAFWDTLNPIQGESLLAINCRHTELFRSAFNRNIESSGIHRSKKQMQETREKDPHVTLRLWQGAEIPFNDNTFNYIFEFDSFECFSDLEVGLKEVQRVLKPKGVFVAVVPNKDFLLSSKYPLSDKTAVSKGYLERSLAEWKRVFTSAGFAIADIKNDQFFIRYRHQMDRMQTNDWKIATKDFLLSSLPLKYAHRLVFFLK
ncbi:class I SAM-dependent methyltransferase [Fodinibius sp.]|uniref:class I SAM-dependent methyltransferase n=1 Tax=Fodinibius sp. TaxID=1872440 RepID=UPI002ACDCF0F|nr:methyltransferase domain-containing protein [Fodinibius sp.]MDZ7659667.1 methyltransferase domain-containing protein [Fodinibius sp.]